MKTFKEKAMKIVFLFTALVSVACVALICVFLISSGVPAMKEIGFGRFLLGRTWRPGAEIYGIFPMIVGSVYVTGLALLIGVPVALLTFGTNSGAYVAEIIRGGIMAVDTGQMEAGRSLGFNFVQTMWYIVIPQALKSVLPALANEFIVLLKETSVACYVAVNDLTKGGEIIRSITYIQAMPLFIVAALYLAMVMFFSYLVTRLERRLRGSER